VDDFALHTRSRSSTSGSHHCSSGTQDCPVLHAEGSIQPAEVRPEDLLGYLGSQRFMPEQTRKTLPFGVATGLAWTETGGDVLYID